MPQSVINNVRLVGVSAVVPQNIQRIDDDIDLFNGNHAQLQRLKKNIGLEQRYVATQNECASDFCEAAARHLLTKCNVDVNTIDGLIFVTQTPDYFQPASSCVLHSKLELSKNCATFDVNLGCSGYVYGLWLASMMIASDTCNRVLLLAGDTMTRCISPQDRSVSVLFGDAGSATLLEKSPKANPIFFALHTDGQGFQYLIIPAGGFRKQPSQETSQRLFIEEGIIRSEEDLYMDGKEIFNFTMREVPSLINEIQTLAGWKHEEVDYYIFHQANRFIIQTIAQKLRLPQKKVPDNVVAKYGNQSSASLPVTLCENLWPLLASESHNLILAGFGVGLSWAACALECGPMVILPVCFYEPHKEFNPNFQRSCIDTCEE